MKKKIVLTLSLVLVLVLGVMSVFALHTGAETPAPALSIDFANLSFRDSITMKFAVKAENAANVKLLCFTEGNGTYEKGGESRALSHAYTETISGTNYLIFDYTGLAAKQMTDVIYVRAYAEAGGKAYYSNVLKYSVLEYVYTMLGKIGNAATSNAELKTLLEDMLTYGASAQKYLNYRTDALATDAFYQVKVKDGLLSDGMTSGLFRQGSQVTVTAASEKDGVPFSHWADASGAKVADTATATITVGGANAVLSPVYKQALTYSEGLEFDSNGDGTCYVISMGDCTDTELVIPPVSPDGDTVIGIEASAFAGEAITSVSFPNTLEEIGRRAFNGCDSLTDVYFDGTEEEWNAVNIATGNTAIENAALHFNAPETDEEEPEYTEPTLVVKNATVSADAETVDVVVAIYGNPGIASLKFDLAYDEALTLQTVKFDAAFGAFVTAPEPFENPQSVSLMSPLADITANGTFATLTFTVSDGVSAGDVADLVITLDNANIFNSAFDPIAIDIVNGSVSFK